MEKSKLEEKLGKEIEYYSKTQYIDYYDDDITFTYLTQESQNDLVNLQLQSLQNGDIETAELCNRILKEDSNFPRGVYGKEQSEELQSLEQENVKRIITEMDGLNENLSVEQLEENINLVKLYQSGCDHIDSELKEKLSEKSQELQTELVEQYSKELQELNSEELTPDKIREVQLRTENVVELCNLVKKDKVFVFDIWKQKVNEKISILDGQISELKEHIELPENEDKIAEIQAQIEEVELAYSQSSEHQKARLEEQGIDMQEIMKDIEETAKLKGRISRINYDRIDGEVNKKTKYLESKLAYLQQYRDISGNGERIAEIESQIETMQDSWVVARSGVDFQEIIENNIKAIDEKKVRLPEAEKELDYTLKYEPAKVGLIQRLEYEVEHLKEQIDRLENENLAIQNGTHKNILENIIEQK